MPDIEDELCPSDIELDPELKNPRPVKSQMEGIKDFSGYLAYAGSSKNERKNFGKRKHEMIDEDEDNFVG